MSAARAIMRSVSWIGGEGLIKIVTNFRNDFSFYHRLYGAGYVAQDDGF